MPFTHIAIPTDRESGHAARRISRFFGIAFFAASTALCAPAFAANGSDLSDPDIRYQKERAACNSGQSHQDRATCLREAGAARDEARRGRLKDGQAPYEQNALIRCKALPPEERQACERRIQGEGVSKGSVAEGGIYREIVTPEPASQSGSMPGSTSSGDIPQGGSVR